MGVSCHTVSYMDWECQPTSTQLEFHRGGALTCDRLTCKTGQMNQWNSKCCLWSTVPYRLVNMFRLFRGPLLNRPKLESGTPQTGSFHRQLWNQVKFDHEFESVCIKFASNPVYHRFGLIISLIKLIKSIKFAMLIPSNLVMYPSHIPCNSPNIDTIRVRTALCARDWLRWKAWRSRRWHWRWQRT